MKNFIISVQCFLVSLYEGTLCLFYVFFKDVKIFLSEEDVLNQRLRFFFMHRCLFKS